MAFCRDDGNAVWFEKSGVHFVAFEHQVSDEDAKARREKVELQAERVLSIVAAKKRDR